MSYEAYIGFITGMMAAIAALVLVLFIRAKRRRGDVEFDERTALIRRRAGEWSFYIAVAFSFIAWVTDNMQAHQRGEAIQFFSTPGILFWVIALAYLVILGYSYYLNSGTLFDGKPTKNVTMALLLFVFGMVPHFADVSVPLLRHLGRTALVGSLLLFGFSLGQHLRTKHYKREGSF